MAQETRTMDRICLWNELGDDSLENQQIVNGNPTGISNLNENKFKWANSLYRKMTGNTWFPEKVSMASDKISVSELTSDEMETLKDTLSFLIFLDSYQSINLPNLAEYITSPSVRNLLAVQNFQEVIHSQSYQYMMEALFPHTTREEVYNRWRHNEVLRRRIKYVADIGNAFLEDKSYKNFKIVLIMNYILEGMYFYHGFMFFDQLASRNKLVQCSTMIDYIRNDEITHIGIFANIIRELFEEDDYIKMEEMMRKAVEDEYEWARIVYGNRILGISESSSLGYLKYLANNRMRILGRDDLYPEVGSENPYRHLEDVKRQNFFESAAVTEYDRAESISGWDEF